MAGIDQCMEMLDHHCEEVFDPYVERLKRCREELGKCEHIRLAETKHYDKSKLVLSVAGLTKGLADTYGAESNRDSIAGRFIKSVPPANGDGRGGLM